MSYHHWKDKKFTLKKYTFFKTSKGTEISFQKLCAKSDSQSKHQLGQISILEFEVLKENDNPCQESEHTFLIFQIVSTD